MFGYLRKSSETFGNLPKPSETLGNLRKPSEEHSRHTGLRPRRPAPELVFWRFRKLFGRLLVVSEIFKISEILWRFRKSFRNFRKLFGKTPETSQESPMPMSWCLVVVFCNYSEWRFPKVSDDFRRFRKLSEAFRRFLKGFGRFPKGFGRFTKHFGRFPTICPTRSGRAPEGERSFWLSSSCQGVAEVAQDSEAPYWYSDFFGITGSQKMQLDPFRIGGGHVWGLAKRWRGPGAATWLSPQCSPREGDAALDGKLDGASRVQKSKM